MDIVILFYWLSSILCHLISLIVRFNAHEILSSKSTCKTHVYVVELSLGHVIHKEVTLYATSIHTVSVSL